MPAGQRPACYLAGYLEFCAIAGVGFPVFDLLYVVSYEYKKISWRPLSHIRLATVPRGSHNCRTKTL
jgi:hypothetical protein